MIANIETAECWRCFSVTAESPRASTTDDVECFFSVLRDQVGKNFTLKQVKYEWRKTCLEFQKRIDPDLPFYYFTAHHDRFYEGPRPGFNEPHTNTHRTRRAPRRERLLFTSGRATLPARGSQHLRAQFHNLPVELPPLPNIPVQISEHSYV